MRHHRISHEERIAKSVHRLERSVFGGKHNRLTRFVIFVIDKDRTTHSPRKPHVTRELRIRDASIINANRYADNKRRKILHAIAHERVRSLFDAGVLRHIHRNLDTSIAALRRRRIRITRRQNRLDRIELLVLSITQMREQVRAAAVIVSVLANRVLERLADAQHTIGFHKRNTELVVAIKIATPLVCKPVLQRFAQIPVVHLPHGNPARREPRIKAAHAKHKPLRLLLVAFALALDTDTILEYRIETIHRDRLFRSLVVLQSLAENHIHRPVLVPTALTVFNQDVFARIQGDLHNLRPKSATRRRNIHRHRMPRRGSHFLDLRPSHVGAFPSRRQHREEPVTRIVARKVHHVIIAQTRYAFRNIERVGHPKFTPNLIHHDTVDTPVETILRSRFAHHHNRTERVNRSPLQHKTVIQRVIRNHDTWQRIRQVSPFIARNIDIQKIARRIGALRPHAAAIKQAARPRMRNHERTLRIRRLRKSHLKRRIVRFMRLHHRIIDKTQVIATACRIVLGRLFALQLLRAIVVDNRLVQLISRPVLGEHIHLDEKFATANRLVISVRKLKMLFPVRNTATLSNRVQIETRCIGIEPAVSCRKRIVRGLLLELHAQHIHIQRIHGMRQREHA